MEEQSRKLTCKTDSEQKNENQRDQNKDSTENENIIQKINNTSFIFASPREQLQNFDMIETIDIPTAQESIRHKYLTLQKIKESQKQCEHNKKDVNLSISEEKQIYLMRHKRMKAIIFQKVRWKKNMYQNQVKMSKN